jgi:hypothetical protein
MKLLHWVIFMGVALAAVTSNAEQTPLLKTPMDKVNYGIGVETARSFRNQGVEINIDLVVQGIKDGLSGNVLIPDKELRKIMTGFQTELRRKRTSSRNIPATDTKVNGIESPVEKPSSTNPVLVQ